MSDAWTEQLLDILMNNGLAVALVVFFVYTSFVRDKASAAERTLLDNWIRSEFISVIQSTSAAVKSASDAVNHNSLILQEVVDYLRGPSHDS